MGSVPIFILAAHILSMLGFATFAALLPELRDLWRLSNFEAGVIGGMFFTGYIATVSYWTPLAGWRTAFLLSALGPLLAGVLVFVWVEPLQKQAPPEKSFSLRTLFPLAAWRRVMANRAAAGYTLGYAAHCLELFGSRAWMVAFLAFSSGFHANASFPWQLATIAAVVNLVAVPASILGNEIALRIGRRRWILVAMAGSGSSGILLGLAAPWHWVIVLGLLVLYSMLVMAESATLPPGLGAAAPGELRGAARG